MTTKTHTNVRVMIVHIACVLALMWPALVNRQPFFFPDTTSYVRAADRAVLIASGRRIKTAWSGDAKPAQHPGLGAAAAPAKVARGNDPDSGVIMAGRSPYFGFLLWLSWTISGFWLFVLAQAATAYALIRLTLRQFDLDTPEIRACTTAVLSLGSTLAFYNSLLLADALAGFGLVAFLLIVTDWQRLSRGNKFFLLAVLLVSCASHLIHSVMLLGMLCVALLWALIRKVDFRSVRPALVAGVLVLVASFGSVMVTSAVVKAVFGRPPALVPLLTARFIADGPGHAFVRSGCGGQTFAVCGIADRPWPSANKFLWSLDPAVGGYLVEDRSVRERMATEDVAFAHAVFRAYPAEQGFAMVSNSVEQFFRFGLRTLNVTCRLGKPCAIAVPPTVLVVLQRTPSGLDHWPQALLTFVVYSVVAAGSIILLWLGVNGRGVRMEDRSRLLFWLAMILVAFAINAVLGGAVSEPQARYQARIIWIVPFLGIVVLCLLRRGRWCGGYLN